MSLLFSYFPLLCREAADSNHITKYVSKIINGGLTWNIFNHYYYDEILYDEISYDEILYDEISYGEIFYLVKII